MFGINCNRTRQSAKRSSATFYGAFDAPFDAASGRLIGICKVLLRFVGTNHITLATDLLRAFFQMCQVRGLTKPATRIRTLGKPDALSPLAMPIR